MKRQRCLRSFPLKLGVSVLVVSLILFTFAVYYKESLFIRDEFGRLVSGFHIRAEDLWSKEYLYYRPSYIPETSALLVTNSYAPSEFENNTAVFKPVTEVAPFAAASDVLSVESINTKEGLQNFLTRHLEVSKETIGLIEAQKEYFNRRLLSSLDKTHDSIGDKINDRIDSLLSITSANAGDILYADAVDSVDTISIGSEGQVLTVESGMPVWADAATSTGGGGFTGGPLTTSVITATSTSATSTFAHSISIASGAEYRIDGEGILTRQGNGAILGGDLTGNARGTSSLDVQSNRNLDTEVASGNYGVAFGYQNTASGNYSGAIGERNTASGNIANAFGFNNTASGNYSVAFGYLNTASGYISNAFGYRNNASGIYASASGYRSTASGKYSVAAGYKNTASATGSSAFGQNITNNIINSTMIGPSNSAKLTILNTGEVQGSFFTATSTNATSTFAHSISIASDAEYRIGGTGVLSRQANSALLAGDLTGNARGADAIDIQSERFSTADRVASGNASLALGHGNTASGYLSATVGYRNLASGYLSTALGNVNTASGDYSSAIGSDNDATAEASSAFGYWNTASGNYSSAFGFWNTASANYASAFGSNITNTIANSAMIGPSNSAKLTILSSGNLGVGTTTPSAKLTVDGTVRFATITGGTLETDALGNVTVASDERLKDIEGKYAAGLEAVLGMTPIMYRWNEESGYDTETLYAGFSAQNVELVLPEAITTNSTTGLKSLSIRPILAAVVNAIQELAAKLSANEVRDDQQDEYIEYLEDRIEELEETLDVEPEARETTKDRGVEEESDDSDDEDDNDDRSAEEAEIENDDEELVAEEGLEQTEEPELVTETDLALEDNEVNEEEVVDQLDTALEEEVELESGEVSEVDEGDQEVEVDDEVTEEENDGSEDEVEEESE